MVGYMFYRLHWLHQRTIHLFQCNYCLLQCYQITPASTLYDNITSVDVHEHFTIHFKNLTFLTLKVSNLSLK